MASQKNAGARINALFSSVASSLGYSEVHGRIIGALVASEKPLSLEELSNITEYSLASISISMDFLEVLGIVRKFREKGDRKVYVRIEGDILSILRRILLMKMKGSITRTVSEFEKYKKDGDENIKRSIRRLESEIRRLEKYINRLSDVEIPQK